MDKNARRTRDDQSIDAVKADEIPTSPETKKQRPFPELPTKMLIAIDGWAQTGKNTSGALVAEHLGGVLVDSGRFYRAITRACLDARVNLNNRAAILAWSQGVTVDVRLAREESNVEEAQVAVNGRWFTQAELKPLGLQTSLVAGVQEVRKLVNATLRMCECYGRVVMLGRDIGGEVFPRTPYKFFLDATEEVREERHVKSTDSTGAVQRDIYDASNVLFAEDSLLIDTSRLSPSEVSGIILIEVFWRAQQTKSSMQKI